MKNVHRLQSKARSKSKTLLHKSVENLGSLRKKYKNLKKSQKAAKENKRSRKQWAQKPKRKFIRSTAFKKGVKTSPHQVKRPSKAKWSCFICVDPKHFANACPNKHKHSNNERINAGNMRSN